MTGPKLSHRSSTLKSWRMHCDGQAKRFYLVPYTKRQDRRRRGRARPVLREVARIGRLALSGKLKGPDVQRFSALFDLEACP